MSIERFIELEGIEGFKYDVWVSWEEFLLVIFGKIRRIMIVIY